MLRRHNISRQHWSTEAILEVLEATPIRISEITEGLEPALLHTPPAEGEWSVNGVLAHLRACADVWGGCITRILAEDEPTYRAVNPRTYIRNTDYPTLEFQESFALFVAQREALLSVLKLLPAESWTRGANVTGEGRPRIRDVHSYARRMALHERPHIRQIKRAVAIVRG